MNLYKNMNLKYSREAVDERGIINQEVDGDDREGRRELLQEVGRSETGNNGGPRETEGLRGNQSEKQNKSAQRVDRGDIRRSREWVEQNKVTPKKGTTVEAVYNKCSQYGIKCHVIDGNAVAKLEKPSDAWVVNGEIFVSSSAPIELYDVLFNH